MKKVLFISVALFAAMISRAQWEPDVRLTNNPGLSGTSLNNAWCIAATGDTVHAVWYDTRDGNDEIYYKRSTDRGVTWEVDNRLTNNPGESVYPSISVSGSVVRIVWFDNRDGNSEIYYKQSNDGGTTWVPDKRLTNAAGGSIFPCIAIADSIVHVAWQDERDSNNGEIYYKRSTDGGLTWGADVRLTNDPDYSGIPCIAVYGQVVHVAWEDYRHQNGDVFYKRSEDGGTTWGDDLRLTTSSADQWDPAIAVSGSDVYLVWEDMRNSNYEIYFNHSSNAGITWETDKRLTFATGDSQYPSIAVSGSYIHIAWQDKRVSNYEIYYKRSIDGGLTWEADTALTSAPDSSVYTSVALSDSVVHVIWQDRRNGNDEIYYKRNPTGNVTPGPGAGVQTAQQFPFRIFPNPASTAIHVRFNESSKEIINLTILDILGKEVLLKQVRDDGNEIDISVIRNGLYFINVSTSTKQFGCAKLLIDK